MLSLFRSITLVLLSVILLAWTLQATETEKQKPETQEENAKVNWYTYQDGWEKATAENKHMFVDFTATWCGWCKKLDKYTFSDPEVIDVLTSDFVPVQVWQKSRDTVNIDGYRITERNLMRKEFKIRGFPALWFVSPQGVRVGPAGGYVDKDRFLNILDIVRYYQYDSTRTETGEKINKEGE